MAVKTIMTKDTLVRDFVEFYNSDKVNDEKLKINEMRSVMEELSRYVQQRVATLDVNEAIQIGNFVKIYVLKRNAQKHRNPKTGEIIDKPETKIVKARVMPIVKRAMKEAEENKN